MKWFQCVGTWIIIVMGSMFAQPVEGTVQDVLAKITLRAEMSKSDVILIAYRGHPIYVFGDDKRLEPMETRSVTKSFVCLAIGMLMQEGKICSLDTPVHHYFPEWKQGLKKDVTLRHLLSNTSGLTIDEGTELYEAPDSVKFALAGDLPIQPGTQFIYNNKAINLLSGIVEKASGMRLQDYLKSHLFQPLGITSDTWLCDLAGHNYGMSHLTINAVDLAKVGLVVINDGYWNGKRLLAREWIETFTQPSQECNPFYGLLWWLDYKKLNIWWDEALINQYVAAGVSSPYIKALKELNGQVFAFDGIISYGNFYESCALQLACSFGDSQAVYRFIGEIEGKGLPLARWDEGELRSFSARGYLGQQLLVIPQEHLVAVRLARSCGQTGCKLDTFADFEGMIEELAQEIRACPRSIEYFNVQAI